ncbi:hypothetical protein [Pseudoalteromonas sp. L1]|uniref:hypothetical protein n=1 Tax=Pseudoalteromonas sp. L1 TaxID=195716 RepID=UPI001F2E36C1|nr:hypothetical protein [Pseudoalteromonas sp. L1]
MIEFVAVTEQDKAYLLDLRLNTMVEHLENQGLFYRLNNIKQEWRNTLNTAT